MPIETAVLPEGWEARAVPVRNENTRDFTGWCVEAHDPVASKLAAFRDKDRDFVRVVLRERRVGGDLVRTRLNALLLPPERKSRIAARLGATVASLAPEET